MKRHLAVMVVGLAVVIGGGIGVEGAASARPCSLTVSLQEPCGGTGGGGGGGGSCQPQDNCP